MQLSKYISLLLGVLPATFSLFLAATVIYFSIHMLTAATETVDYNRVAIGCLWSVFTMWGYFELCKASLHQSKRPLISTLGLGVGILSFSYSNEALAIFFDGSTTPTKSPFHNLFTPSLNLTEAWIFLCPTLVALYHITIGNAAIWREA